MQTNWKTWGRILVAGEEPRVLELPAAIAYAIKLIESGRSVWLHTQAGEVLHGRSVLSENDIVRLYRDPSFPKLEAASAA